MLAKMIVRILFIGDVVGAPGRSAVTRILPALREQHAPDLIVINGENAAGGFGITADTALDLFRAGADILTSGNHIWDKKIPELFSIVRIGLSGRLTIRLEPLDVATV